MGGTSLTCHKSWQDMYDEEGHDGHGRSVSPTGLRIVQDIRTHPNYEETEPVEGESIVAFTLRCAAHLISPPMESDEDNEFECVDIAAQILTLEKSITKRWEKS